MCAAVTIHTSVPGVTVAEDEITWADKILRKLEKQDGQKKDKKNGGSK